MALASLVQRGMVFIARSLISVRWLPPSAFITKMPQIPKPGRKASGSVSAIQAI
jgi:hypothetical protein